MRMLTIIYGQGTGNVTIDVRQHHDRAQLWRTGIEQDRSDAVDAKRQKFRQSAESRRSKAIDAIGRIGNLSNRAICAWEDAEVRKVSKALKDAVAELAVRFASPKGNAMVNFKS
jgi:hypothetical protein